jgi:hypothetical protein
MFLFERENQRTFVDWSRALGQMEEMLQMHGDKSFLFLSLKKEGLLSCA